MPRFSKFLFLAVASCMLFAARPVRAQDQGQTICAGNIPPEGTVITATGNSVDCGGSCRARQIEPIRGQIMVVCAQQPIPDRYEIQSVTTSPACNCLGEDDNAYVLRAVGGGLTNPGAARLGLPPGSSSGSDSMGSGSSGSSSGH